MVARLEARGLEVRRGSRRASPAFDWLDDASWLAALEGVDAIYLAYPADLPLDGASERIGALIERAREMWTRGDYAIVGDWFAAASRAAIAGLALDGRTRSTSPVARGLSRSPPRRPGPRSRWALRHHRLVVRDHVRP